MEKVKKTKAQWPELLSYEAYLVTREKCTREHLAVNMINSMKRAFISVFVEAKSETHEVRYQNQFQMGLIRPFLAEKLGV